MKSFADTGFYIALLNRHDQFHGRAVKAAAKQDLLVTTSAIIGETVTLLQRRGRIDEALAFLSQIQRQARTLIIHPDETLHQNAWRLFVQYAPTGASIVDCVSFAAMQQAGIRNALTFDDHFRAAGFSIL